MIFFPPSSYKLFFQNFTMKDDPVAWLNCEQLTVMLTHYMCEADSPEALVSEKPNTFDNQDAPGLASSKAELQVNRKSSGA